MSTAHDRALDILGAALNHIEQDIQGSHHKVPDFPTLVALAKASREEGFTVLTADEPDQAGIGLSCFRNPSGKEEAFAACFYPYGQLVPEVEVLEDAKDWWAFFNAEDVYSNDDPLRRRLGGVRYIPKEGKAIVKYIGLANLKKTISGIPREVQETLKTAEGRRKGMDGPFSEEKRSLLEALGP